MITRTCFEFLVHRPPDMRVHTLLRSPPGPNLQTFESGLPPCLSPSWLPPSVAPVPNRVCLDPSLKPPFSWISNRHSSTHVFSQALQGCECVSPCVLTPCHSNVYVGFITPPSSFGVIRSVLVLTDALVRHYLFICAVLPLSTPHHPRNFHTGYCVFILGDASRVLFAVSFPCGVSPVFRVRLVHLPHHRSRIHDVPPFLSNFSVLFFHPPYLNPISRFDPATGSSAIWFILFRGLSLILSSTPLCVAATLVCTR